MYLYFPRYRYGSVVPIKLRKCEKIKTKKTRRHSGDVVVVVVVVVVGTEEEVKKWFGEIVTIANTYYPSMVIGFSSGH